ncbi:divalent-cation tolerance protein CutA [Rhodopirellula sp. MGV]|uniref:divalent-cation tolerance protein CutA n=1 Tax=Rhodopirellula sp. MGV TaxID=2023130 RepID=UPI000B97A07D|nr:divalent-cation tolerance protein CutA [Rhodopirellula sp. MGV]OYP37292.1 hypothetical protein CGZ80_05600 [Rhodopirellula sp. MGV]PNY38071.1 divalent-cation tolerance protein CutA [Rhodopirellula baltica]
MDDRPQLVVCLTTVSDQQQAETLAQSLIDQHLAACVQIDAPIKSYYRWDGKICVDPEVRLVIKTAADQSDALMRGLQKLHPYTQPQIVMLPCSDADPGYVDWVRRSINGETRQ